MLPLRRIEIRNFRSLRTVDLDLHPQVTVLFGANAAGKTSVLDALAIALGAIVRRVPGAKGRDFAQMGDIRVPWLDSADGEERARVRRPFARLRVHTGTLSWEVSRLRSPQDRLPEPGPGVRALHDWLDPLLSEAQDRPPGSRTPPLPMVAAYGNERAVVEVPLRERNFDEEIQRFAALDGSLAATTRFKAVFEWFRAVEDEERRAQIERRDFDYRLPALEWVRRAVARAGLSCRNPRVQTQPIRMLVDFLHGDDESPEELDLRSLSDGYRTHFALVVDIARRMVQLNPSDDLNDPERGTHSAGVVLIDEIDLHLDPVWQGRVLQGLLEAFPNTQFVVTTHSEQVIASVARDNVRRLRWHEGAVRVEPVPFAQGASGERILVELMDAPERVAGEVKTRLDEYLTLVSRGQGRSDTAQDLRRELERQLPQDSALHRAELELQRQDLMARIAQQRAGKT